MSVLVMCSYGNDDLGAECCLVDDGSGHSYKRCPVFDWEECPFGKEVGGCGTCAHPVAMTFDGDERMVDCAENDMQMYSPYATECKHWEKAVEPSV